jgi:hypothetical protein
MPAAASIRLDGRLVGRAGTDARGATTPHRTAPHRTAPHRKTLLPAEPTAAAAKPKTPNARFWLVERRHRPFG